jgi:hypothetical protein
MKVTNWTKKLLASLVASGAIASGSSYAVDIPLGDPSFDLYVVPANPGYAYAQPPNGSYRPTSPWVDDLDSPLGFAQDAGSSNWLYTAAYAEPPGSVRPAPRTGNQAMHGLDGNFNAQELTTTFEAGKAYTFKIWAQNDVLLDQGDGVGIYIFDGNVPFSPVNSLSSNFFTTTVPKRIDGMTPAQSQANWGQFSITHVVLNGAPEIGHPIGVGFRAFRDSAVDDATLTSDDASTQVLVLEVNTVNGQMRMRNQTAAPVNIDYYEITSASSALNAVGWDSLREQNLPGFPAGNGSGNGWEEAGGSSSSILSESYLTGNSALANGTNVGLGAGFNVGGAQTVTFKYGKVANLPNPVGDYDNNGTVDATDYVLWRNGGPLLNDPSFGVQPSDYDQWKENFGKKGGLTGPGVLTAGFVRYVTSFSGSGAALVPEPTGIILVGIGMVTLAAASRRRTDASERHVW